MEMIDSILNETESSIDRQWRDMEFCYEVMEQHREMEKFVNECLIMASGNKKAINEMYILNEAAFGDKVKAFFEKIKNFFKKIFDKLGASMSALFSEQKKYMEKYAYIITKCKWQAGDISDMKDHFTGIPRIIDMLDTNIESALFGKLKDNGLIGEDNNKPTTINLDISNLQPEEKKDITDVKQNIYKEFIQSDYWKNKNITEETDSNSNTNIDATFRTYFDGSSDTITLSGDEVDEKFQMVINVTYAGQAYLNKLEKIVSTVDKKMDQISKNTEDELKKMEEDLRSKVKALGTNEKPTNKSVTKEELNKLKPGENGKYKFGEVEGDSIEDLKQKLKNAGYEIIEQTGNEKKIKVADFTKISANRDGTYTYKGVTKPSKAELRTELEKQGYVFESWSYNNSKNKNYILELNITTSNKTNDVDNKAAADKYTAIGTQNEKNLSASNTKISNMNASKNTSTYNVSNNSNVQVNDELNKKVDTYLDSVVHNRQANVNALVQITSSIAKAAFSSFKNANSDFWTIIKAHVQYYLSNPGSEKNSENQTTRVKQLDINAGMSVDTKNPTPPPKTEPTK